MKDSLRALGGLGHNRYTQLYINQFIGRLVTERPTKISRPPTWRRPRTTTSSTNPSSTATAVAGDL
jgi:hypothetical protein